MLVCHCCVKIVVFISGSLFSAGSLSCCSVVFRRHPCFSPYHPSYLRTYLFILSFPVLRRKHVKIQAAKFNLMAIYFVYLSAGRLQRSPSDLRSHAFSFSPSTRITAVLPCI